MELCHEKIRRALEETGPSRAQRERLVDRLEAAQQAPPRQAGAGRRKLTALLVLCAVLAATALAAGPTLWQTIRARQGPFAFLAQTLEGAACIDQGIEIQVLSALADDVRGEVYFTVRDTTGDRLDDQLILHRARESDLTGRLVEYDSESRTALFVADLSYQSPQTEAAVSIATLKKSPEDSLCLAVDGLSTRQGDMSASVSCAGVTDQPLDSLLLGETDKVVMGVEESGYPASILPEQQVVLAPGQTPMELEGTRDMTISSMGFAADGCFHVRVAYAPGIDHGDLDMGYFLVRVYPKDENRVGEDQYWRATVITQVDGGLDMLFPLIKAGEGDELDQVYFYGGYRRPGIDITGNWTIDFTLAYVPSVTLDWTGELAGRRVDRVTVSPMTVTMDSSDAGAFSTTELYAVYRDGTRVEARPGAGRYTNVSQAPGEEVWNAYTTWEFEEPVQVEDIDHLTLLGETIPLDP